MIDFVDISKADYDYRREQVQNRVDEHQIPVIRSNKHIYKRIDEVSHSKDEIRPRLTYRSN
jgi:hypothetical protein